MCETTDYTPYAILIRKTNNCAHEVETYCIYYSVQLTSLNKKRAKLLARRATPEHPAFTLITSAQWNVLFSLPEGAGHGTVLSQVQFLGQRIKILIISDLRKGMSSRKYLSPSRKRSSPEKRAWHGPSDSRLHAVLSKLAIHNRNWVCKLWNNSWRETSEAAGETPLLKLHYQIRLSSYTAVCDDQPHPRSSATDWSVRTTSALLSLLAGWTYKYPVLGCWEHEQFFLDFLFFTVDNLLRLDRNRHRGGIVLCIKDIKIFF